MEVWSGGVAGWRGGGGADGLRAEALEGLRCGGVEVSGWRQSVEGKEVEGWRVGGLEGWRGGGVAVRRGVEGGGVEGWRLGVEGWGP